MNKEQMKLVERLAKRYADSDDQHSHDGFGIQEAFIAGATHSKIAELYRTEGRIEAYKAAYGKLMCEGISGCFIHCDQQEVAERECLAALLGEGESR